MAFPHPRGLLPSETAFLCEMEMITIVPRLRLERLDLLGGPTNPLIPPQRTELPLWLALLLKRQKRVDIYPPPWLQPDSLRHILELETEHYPNTFSPGPQHAVVVEPKQTRDGGDARRQQQRQRTDYEGQTYYTSTPFLGSMTTSAPADALPYHWFELAEMLLDGATDNLDDPDTIRRLLKELREVRLAKMRRGVEVLSGEGDGVQLDGVGATEVSESRGFITGVMDGLRKIGASKEQARREREEEERGQRGYDRDEDEDEDMT